MENLKIACIGVINGEFQILNRMDFTDLSEMEFSYRLMRDGEILEQNTFDVNGKPHETINVKLNYEVPINAKYGAFIEIYMNTASATTWCEKGFNIAWAQFEIPTSRIADECEILQDITVEESNRYVEVKSQDKTIQFDKAYGTICSIMKEEKELLSKVRDVEDSKPQRQSFW